MENQIDKLYIERLYNEWSRLVKVSNIDKHTSDIKVEKPFMLGLLVGHIMNRWVKDGQSFDEMIVDTKNCNVRLSAHQDSRKNRLKTSWIVRSL